VNIDRIFFQTLKTITSSVIKSAAARAGMEHGVKS